MRAWHYVGSALAVGAAALAAVALAPLLDGRYPLATFYVATVLVATAWGWPPAALAAFAGYVLGDRLLLRDGLVSVGLGGDVLEAIVYALLSAALIGFADRAQRSRTESVARSHAAEQARVELEHEARERRAAEQALRASEAQFRRIADSMLDIAYVRDPQGELVYTNPRWREYTGLTPGSSAENMEAVHPDDRDRLARIWREGRDTGRPCAAEFRLRAADGTYRWFMSRAVPVRENGDDVTAWIGTTVDIHESRAAREAALRSEERLRLAIDGTGAGLWDQDLATGEMLWSERAREILGASSDVAPSSALFRRLVDPADLPAVIAAYERLAQAPDQPLALEFRVRTEDGRTRWILTRGRVYAGADGRPRRASGLLIDVTERRALEEELRATDRRKDEFLAVLAHELRNPLAPVRYATRLLASDTPPEMAADARRMIDRQLAHMARLLDDLLDVNRINRGRLELRSEVLDLRSIVDAAVASARPLIESVGHRLDVRQWPSAIAVHGDATRLGQIVDNLLSNAAKYSESGGEIVVAVEADERQARVRVRDRGIGIAPETLPRLFELFMQVRPANGGKGGGLGIGLALSRQLAELHGGRLEGMSEGLGHGSEFTLTLPRSVERPAVATEPAAAANVVALPRRQAVLIADDNVDAALSLSRLLEARGYATHVAHDGVTALEMAEVLRPEIVILDLGMPRLGGIEVARTLRRQGWAGAMRLIALTGWGQPTDREQTRAAGFDAHVTKPADPDELLALLDAPRGGAEPRSTG